jgi:hypothetical protein
VKLAVPLPPEKQFVIVCQSPDYVDPGEPVYAHDWDVLLDHARASLESRRASYPAWIAKGQISAEDAAADIAGWEAIVAEWTWALTGEGEMPPPGSHPRRRAAVTLQLDRIRAQLDRGNRTADIARQAHAAMALAWQYDRTDPPAEPAFHLSARLNHQLRREGRTKVEWL